VWHVTRLVHLFLWFLVVGRNRPALNHWVYEAEGSIALVSQVSFYKAFAMARNPQQIILLTDFNSYEN